MALEDPHEPFFQQAVAYRSETATTPTAYNDWHKRIAASQADFDGDGELDTVRGMDIRFSLDLTASSKSLTMEFGNSGNCSVGFDDIDGDRFLDVWRCDCGDGYVQIFWGDGRGGIAGTQRLFVHNITKAAFVKAEDDESMEMVAELYDDSRSTYALHLVRLERSRP